MATRSRSQIAKSNNNKGKEAERQIARWLNDNGFPDADRTRRTGYNAGGSSAPDEGDIAVCPGVIIQSKYWQRSYPTEWLGQAAEQAHAAGADVAIVVHRRQGKSSPGRWWAYVHATDVSRLHAGASGVQQPAPLMAEALVPVCMELGDLVPLLRAAGYGTPVDQKTAEEVAA